MDCPPLLQESLDPPFYDFSKITRYKSEGGILIMDTWNFPPPEQSFQISHMNDRL